MDHGVGRGSALPSKEPKRRAFVAASTMLLQASLAEHAQSGVQEMPQYEQQGFARPRRGPVQVSLQLQGLISSGPSAWARLCVS